MVKNVCANAGDTEDLGLATGSGRSPGEGNGKHFSILVCEILWTEEPGRLQPMGLHRVRHDSAHRHACRGGHSGACCAGGCISHAKVGIFTKAHLGLNEEEHEISLIRGKKNLTGITLMFVLIEKQEMCFGTHPKGLPNKRSEKWCL